MLREDLSRDDGPTLFDLCRLLEIKYARKFERVNAREFVKLLDVATVVKCDNPYEVSADKEPVICKLVISLSFSPRSPFSVTIDHAHLSHQGDNIRHTSGI